MNDLSKLSENSLLTGSDGGKGMANLIYILYIVGFFTGITALVGAVLAYTSRQDANAVCFTHFNHQLRIFKWGIMTGIALFVLNAVIGLLAAVTFGFGLLLLLVPAGIAIWWMVWTIMQIAKGMRTLGKGEVV
jgi:uncharacterized membrane protein